MPEDYNLIFLTKFKERLKAMALSKAVELAYGNMADFAEYKRSCGVVEGLNYALDIATEIHTELEKEWS